MVIQTQTFTESPFKALKIFAAIMLAVFVFFALLFSMSGNSFLTKENALSDLIIISAVAFGSLVITFLITSFTPKRKIVCTSEECEIWITNFWNSYYGNDSFRWSEVTDTNLIEGVEVEKIFNQVGVMTYFFTVEVNNQTKRLLNQKMSTNKNFSGLIKFVNEATPNLKYVWENTSDFNKRQVIVEILNYSKVARIK